MTPFYRELKKKNQITVAICSGLCVHDLLELSNATGGGQGMKENGTFFLNALEVDECFKNTHLKQDSCNSLVISWK